MPSGVIATIAAAMACAALLACPAAGAQTLGELAAVQRAKQQAELLKSQKDLADAQAAATPKPERLEPTKVEAEETKAATRRAALAARPKIVLHALYARNGVWVAELASGQGLALALVGMQVYGNRISAIDQRGLVLFKPCTAQDASEKSRCGQRILVLGEAV
ncbi:hypothetical protein NU688_32995 [Variovorax sp. ZS18.2.2]|uniref:hypothetical protein n=1 Tax=Variovorax sp. ZS18.2.2 TaxID=2971255 RepID=UPI002151361F|nr:hypothetical protein [Variovorax sp. ZS18.2.2]MCR6481015.1 hypothetical protein [Variovorax sp. ZS18.2.2]